MKSIKTFYAELSKKWLVVFLLSFISTMAYCFLGIPRTQEATGTELLFYHVWGTVSFVMTVFSLFMLTWLKWNGKEWTYSERMSSLKRTVLGCIIGIVIIVLIIWSINNPSEPAKLSLASIFLMLLGLIVLGLLGMFNLFLDKKFNKKYGSHEIFKR